MADGNIKFVVAGDTGVGKTAFLTTWAFGNYPHEFIAATLSSWSHAFKASNGKEYISTPWDIQGRDEVRAINTLAYPTTDLFVYTYSVADPVSLEHVKSLWVPETRAHCPEAPCVLLGLKKDLRDNPSPGKELKDYVTTKKGKALADAVGAKAFFELSALQDPAEILSNAMQNAENIAATFVEEKLNEDKGEQRVVTSGENTLEEGYNKKEKCSVQ